ncbi:DUF5615 family PIN-like protein [soil metagenome]
MKFKVDENLPRDVAALLRAAGFDACTIQDQGMVGQPDETIASVCREEGRAIVTMDMDFGDIRRFPPENFAGLIVLRADEPSKPVVLQLIKNALGLLAESSPVGSLWIVTEEQIRVRRGGRSRK